MKNKIDYFNPIIVVVGILAFLAMGYIGSFNYRFEDPLKLEVILTVIFACIVFSIGVLLAKHKINIESKEISFLSDVRFFFLVSKRCSNKMEYTVEPHGTLPHIHTAKYFFSKSFLHTTTAAVVIPTAQIVAAVAAMMIFPLLIDILLFKSIARITYTVIIPHYTANFHSDTVKTSHKIKC